MSKKVGLEELMMIYKTSDGGWGCASEYTMG
jgi:hypothetical protein